MDPVRNDVTWVACGAAALLLRTGLGVYTVGLVRAKNAAGTALRTVADLCLAALAFWAVGNAIYRGGGPAGWHGVIGFNPQFLCSTTNGVSPAGVGQVYDLLDFSDSTFRLLTAVLIGTGVVAGSLAERSRFFPSLAPSVLLAGLVIPVSALWVWNGWLARAGFADLGGAAAIHLPAAVCAAVGAAFVGPRMGKYNRDGSTSPIPGHSVPLASGGTMLMLAAWAPYLIGFAAFPAASAGPIALNVLLAAAAGGLAGLLSGQFRYHKPDVQAAHAGLLGGLVAITAFAHHAAGWQAVLVGAGAGLLVPSAAAWIELTWKIDDPGGGIAVHGVGAAWGILAAGLFARGTSSTAGAWFAHLGVQLLGAAAVAAWALLTSLGLFALLKSRTRLRLRDADEYEGADLVEHEAAAYPDFHQTMIKSY